MPEGDTIFRAAVRLRAVLAGREVLRAESFRLGATVKTIIGHKITSVQARGKHLLFEFDDGRVLHSHMGMTGSWHIYRPGEAWQKPAYRAHIQLEGADFCVVCFTPPVLEILTATGVRRHDYLNRLGPDLLAGPPPEAEVIARFRQASNLSIGEAVMNQTIVSGIGNVYKSELLFQLGLHPLRLVSTLTDEELLQLTTLATEMMERNLSGRPRTTRYALDGGRFYAYGRSGKPCYRCRTPIALIRQGDLGRTTYFCPQCQSMDGARIIEPRRE